MIAKFAAAKVRYVIGKLTSPTQVFHSDSYLRHNSRRLEHLASLRIPIAGMSVLEVGAGIGDHSHYYIDRQCEMTITEVRAESLSLLKKRYPNCNIRRLDLETASHIDGGPFDVVHCYGLLYHLSDPEKALTFLSGSTRVMLFLETCVSFGEDDHINPVEETKSQASQAFSGTGCRPTRTWLYGELRRHFEYVYVPRTQPCHEEFPIDWKSPEKHTAALQRAIFIGSRKPLQNELLTTELETQQIRQC